MKRLWYIVVLLIAGCGDENARKAYDALRGGNSHFKAGRYTEAISKYDEASFDARAMHNGGKAGFRAGEWNVALERLNETPAMMSETLSIAAAYHDIGTTRAAQALWADSSATAIEKELAITDPSTDDIVAKLRRAVERDSLRQQRNTLSHLADSALVQSIKAFKESLRKEPTDEDTRFNLAYTQHVLALREKAKSDAENDKKEDQELSENAKALLAKAEELVEANRFKEALELLQQGLQQDPTLAKEQQYIDKLDVVTKAAEAQ